MPNFSPGFEADRVAALTRHAMLDTSPGEDFERITSLAAHLCGTPVARISFVDETWVWFKLALVEQMLGMQRPSRCPLGIEQSAS